MTQQKIALITAWHNEEQKNEFVKQWDIENFHDEDVQIYLTQDENKEGCARTKNKGIVKAYKDGCTHFIVLDDDCYPHDGMSLRQFIDAHVNELNRAYNFNCYAQITWPASRGTPENRMMLKPVYLCMGFWSGVPDLWATDKSEAIRYEQKAFDHEYFSLCGMNFSFRREVAILCLQIPIDRYEDTWAGLIAQKYIYAIGGCCSTCGPIAYHSRQSNREENIEKEAEYKDLNETMWQAMDLAVVHFKGDIEEDRKDLWIQTQLIISKEIEL